MKPCDDLKGLIKAQCMAKARIVKKQKKDGVQRRNDDKVLNRSAKCADEEGSEKVQCFRKHGIKSMIKKAVRKEVKRTIRGKLQGASSSESSED